MLLLFMKHILFNKSMKNGFLTWEPHTDMAQDFANRRDICASTVLLLLSWLACVGILQLISTSELQRASSKWPVAACCILRLLLRNVRSEFTAPNADASAPCAFQL